MGLVFKRPPNRNIRSLQSAIEKMLPIKSRPWSLLIFLYVTFMVASSVEPSNDRLKKHFSLFSVVQFNNEECTSDTSPAGGTTQGTCYTSTECTDKGGVQAGKCASGFGVCCVFINAVQANAAIMENRTRLRNEDYPAIDDAAADQAIVWTINKMQSDICQIRLDFTRFVIAGPTSTAENMAAQAATNCDVDTLQITTTAVNQVGDTSTGIMCGALTGEHLYVELSVTATDTATITLNTGVATQNAAAADRIWDIKVSQIQCFATYRAPEGCDRYIMDNVGSITSLNFMILNNGDGFNTGIELANQRVKTCIRRSKGMCCVQYQQCASFNGIALGTTDQLDAANDNTGYGSNNAMGNAQRVFEAWSLDTNTNPYAVDINTGAAIAGITVDGIAVTMPNPVVASQVNIGMVDNQCSGDYVEI